MDLSLATATEANANAIATICNAAAELLTRQYGHGHWSSSVTEGSVLRDLSRPQFSRTLVARDGADIIATLRLQTKKPWAINTAYFTSIEKALYLIDMAVHPHWQRKGVGRRLLREAAAIARDWPGNAIRLDAWDADAGAGPFYARCGYREVGRAVYRKAPLIYFELLL